MVGNARNLVKPVPLRLCGQDLPWVETATHLGHELHSSGSMEHDTKIARARYIDQTVEVRQSFSFASPVEVVRALEVYTTSYYGSMLWNLKGNGADQFFNSWTTAIKLVWDCPRATRTYLVQQVLGCGSTSARTEIMARYSRFFQGLRSSPSREVATLVNLVARDIRSCTGSNISMVTEQSGKDPWVESSASIRSGLRETEAVHVQDQDKWRVGYLGLLLAQRQSCKYIRQKMRKRRCRTWWIVSASTDHHEVSSLRESKPSHYLGHCYLRRNYLFLPYYCEPNLCSINKST